MARAISTDPYMTFRFALRLSRESPWIGFSAIEVCPEAPGCGAGSLKLEKSMGEEFLSIMKLGKTNLNIGIFHISEALNPACADPDFQIDIHGANFTKLMMSPIVLDAMARKQRQARGDKEPPEPNSAVLLATIRVPYDRADFHIKETSFKSATVPTHYRADVVAVPGRVIM